MFIFLFHGILDVTEPRDGQTHSAHKRASKNTKFILRNRNIIYKGKKRIASVSWNFMTLNWTQSIIIYSPLFLHPVVYHQGSINLVVETTIYRQIKLMLTC